MPSSTDYAKEYGKAEIAYFQGNYEEAAAMIDRLAEEFPDDPSVLLLKGHVYGYGLHQYEEARSQYEAVLNLTNEPDFINYAHSGLEYASQSQAEREGDLVTTDEDEGFEVNDFALEESSEQLEQATWDQAEDSLHWDEPNTSQENFAQDNELNNPFSESASSEFKSTSSGERSDPSFNENPFALGSDDHDEFSQPAVSQKLDSDQTIYSFDHSEGNSESTERFAEDSFDSLSHDDLSARENLSDSNNISHLNDDFKTTSDSEIAESDEFDFDSLELSIPTDKVFDTQQADTVFSDEQELFSANETSETVVATDLTPPSEPILPPTC